MIPLGGKAACQAVDSTGIKAEGAGEWNARKHGGSKRYIWRKIHIGIDEETLEVRAVESSLANGRQGSATGQSPADDGPKEPVDGSNIGDAPILPELLDQIAADEQIGSVTADGALGAPPVPDWNGPPDRFQAAGHHAQMS